LASEPLILGFDTSAAHCAAALLCGDRIVAHRAEEMTRGQVERLMPLLEEMLLEAGAGWADLTRIGVGIGPGNFTGIRIAVSAARGLALALDIPAVGVSSFEATSLGQSHAHLPVVPGPQGQVYMQALNEAPRIVPMDEAQALGLPLIEPGSAQALAEGIARIAAAHSGTGLHPPAPLYVKSADAAPSRVTAPVMLDDDA
jgi:tRNA threonylcarbamoyl adenosine modification protein YeaZ